MENLSIIKPWYQDAVINNIAMPTRRGGKDSSEYRWNFFIKPFIEDDGRCRRFIELGSNAGFYLRKASNLNFETIGVENDPLYVSQAHYWEEKEPLGTKTIALDLNEFVIPAAHTVLLANIIYYLNPGQVLSLVNILEKRVLNVIVLSRHNRISRIKYPCEKKKIFQYFSGWNIIDSKEDKKHWSVLFKNPKIIEADIHELVIYNTKNLKKGELFESSFSEMVKLMDSGKPFDITKSAYYNYFIGMPHFKRMKYIERAFNLFDSVKKNGVLKPLIIKKHINDYYRVWDGDHRFIICKYLGIDKIICLIL